ncbi:SMP-30/gluconolactonase/LRE family protein [Fibrella sp. HMF5405]|uniref:SMP-30/gluconolactonase/LRE family protein n=2 Tax=Fibrella forsythiae TaxID=2817061 RepID=A0ABS3JD71_9BACT|nr:SMP-30/gluconolactonase/LRE family protein [Fibrella forsythiae]
MQLGCGAPILAQLPQKGNAKQGSMTTIGEVIRIDARLNQLIPVGATIEVIGSGFGHLEGPVWVRDSVMLLFSDSEHQTIYRWSPSKGLSKFLTETGYTGRLPYSKEPGTNGLAITREGHLLICEHGDRRVAILPMTPKNGKRTLTDSFEGKRLNSPNDVVVHSSGSVYFTDPPYGLPKREKDSTRETPFSGVYRLASTGRLALLTRDLNWPNGLAFSPDEQTLYLTESDSLNSRIMAYPVRADGDLGKGKVFFEMSNVPKQLPNDRADGLKVDRDGNVWATGHGGVLILTPTGVLLGRISTGETIANVAWGDDGSTLYMASGPYLCRIRTSVKGW